MKKFKYALGAFVFSFMLVAGVAGSNVSAVVIEDKTCKDLDGYSQNLEGDVSGAWGSIEFDQDNGPLVLNVNDGYVVDLCVKKGSEASGQGPIDLGSFNGPIEDEEVNYPNSVPSEGFSHYAFTYALVDEPGYFFEFEKVWTGDEVDLDGVTVVFHFGENEWTLGDPAVEVEPGQTIEPLSEVVTGLPDNCTYKSDLPESYTVFGEWQYEKSARTNIAVPQRYVDTLTVTNEVTCEEDEPGEVLGETTTKDPQVVAPVGAVNAGTGSSAISAVAVAGLVASGIATGFAVVRTVKGE